MFNRSLDDLFIKDFIELMSNYLQTDVTREEVLAAGELFNEIEKNIQGRIAGDVEDYIFNYFLRKHVAKKFQKTNHVNIEIGVLFGGSFIFTLKAVEKTDVKFIGIDPLNGYYIKDTKADSKTDKFSGHEVSIETLKNNLDTLNIPEDSYQIWQGYSTNKEYLERLKGTQVSVLFIDGDHSYEGIKFDLLEYEKFVMDGGYIIIDNYNDVFWPEVKIFCDECLSQSNLKIGRPLVFGRSIILEKGQSLTPAERFAFKSEKNLITKQHENIKKINTRLTELNSEKEKLIQEREKLRSEIEKIRLEKESLEVYKNKFLKLKQNPIRFIAKYFFTKKKI